MEKGQANVFWIIIGAVIALVVLAVLLLMFTGKTNTLEQGISGCEVAQGKCVANEAACDAIKGNVISTFDCVPVSNVCCMGSKENNEES